jgi:hypothetical protein
MEGRHVVCSINLVSWNGTGYGIGVTERECGLLQPYHLSREGFGLDVGLVSVS